MKGTVTPLSSLFAAEEAQKAAKRVQDTIEEKQQELERLRGFISDNANLINTVQRLPDNLHHDIMASQTSPLTSFQYIYIYIYSHTHTHTYLYVFSKTKFSDSLLIWDLMYCIFRFHLGRQPSSLGVWYTPMSLWYTDDFLSSQTPIFRFDCSDNGKI